jgi:hypothetical protein
MIARRQNETVRSSRTSPLVAVSKARVWASEGWHVTIIDGDGKIFEQSRFDELWGNGGPGDRKPPTVELTRPAND